MKKNWDRAAMRFASAKHADRQGMLDFKFENGDHFLVATESILSGDGHTRFKSSGSSLASGVTPPGPPRLVRNAYR